MKSDILFLDIDGVLNSVYSFKYYFHKYPSLYKNNSIRGKNDRPHPWHVGILNKIIRLTNVKIVISSTWRLCGIDLCRFVLHNNMVVGDIIDITPVFPGMPRGDEIQSWLDNNNDKWNKFVILDDDSDMGVLLPYLIKTDFATGLQRKHIKRVYNILKG